MSAQIERNQEFIDDPDYKNLCTSLKRAYQQLPQAVRCNLTPKQFQWLPENEKKDITTDMCMPDEEADY